MKDSDHKFDQYKMFVDSAEKNSENRIKQSNFYLTINLAFLSYTIAQGLDLPRLIIAAAIGVTICVVWLLTISNYAKRNGVKFDIINEMENDFNALFSEEWKRVKILTPLSRYEKTVAVIFIVAYVATVLVQIFTGL